MNLTIKDHPMLDVSILAMASLSKVSEVCSRSEGLGSLSLLHSEWPKLYGVLAVPSARGLKVKVSTLGLMYNQNSKINK